MWRSAHDVRPTEGPSIPRPRSAAETHGGGGPPRTGDLRLHSHPNRPAPEDPVSFDRALGSLREHFGYPGFRPAQVPVVRAVLDGRDVLAVLPTGGGKSICFQVPATLEEGVTLVISPLISLMEDQVAGARRHGLAAACLSSSSTRTERREVERRVGAGEIDLLYVSPERLQARRFLDLLEDVRITRIAVDEAHCISQWGHDFRPAYRRIAGLFSRVGRPPVAAFTATATPRTRADIISNLRLRRPARLVSPVDRPNLVWRAESASSLAAAARRLITAARGRTGAVILYARTRRQTIRLAEACRRAGIAARPYHAGLPAAVRSGVQEDFLEGRTPLVCATNAFGMGVDHDSVRLVGHLGMPDSLEAYVQEAGRAGRDGERSDCLLVSYPGDADLQRSFIDRSWPSARLLSRVWAAFPPGRPTTLAELTRLTRGRAGEEAVGSAVRLLTGFGCVRSRPDRERTGTVYVRGPERLRRRIDFGLCARGRERARDRLGAMHRYVTGPDCRRASIAAYFGERAPRCAGCDRCGTAARPRRSSPVSPAAREG